MGAACHAATWRENVLSRNLIVILRGVRPGEAVRIAGAVLDAGMDKIEVPLNSPDPFDSIAALEAGVDGLKVFPASTWGPSGVSAVWSVLPKGVPIYAVGGVNADDLSGWIRAGVAGFGIGSSLYKAGNGVEDVAAASIVKSYDDAIAGQEAWQVGNPK